MVVFLGAPWNVLLVWGSLTLLNSTFHLKKSTSLQNEAHIKYYILLVSNFAVDKSNIQTLQLLEGGAY